jgi:hypothetical protein
MIRYSTATLLLVALVHPVSACSLCAGAQQAFTLRQEAAQSSARLILVGTLHNPRLDAKGVGATDLRLIKNGVLRSDPILAKREVVELPRYLEVSDPKNPPVFLVFCDVFRDKLDPFRGVPLKSAAALDYVTKALALDPKDRVGNLVFFFDHLDSADPEVSRDAFLEFAKAADQDLGAASPRFSADKLRRWLRDTATPPERLSLYALLLGACGAPADAALFDELLNQKSERTQRACDGLLAGYIRLKPREGWARTNAVLADARQPLLVRLGAVRALRFFHGWQPRENRAELLHAMTTVLRQGELADLAVEDLRQWKMWDLTPEILALYGKKGYDAPLMQRAFIRYALSCKDRDDAKRFLDDRRRSDADLVKDVEESLAFEQPK